MNNNDDEMKFANYLIGVCQAQHFVFGFFQIRSRDSSKIKDRLLL